MAPWVFLCAALLAMTPGLSAGGVYVEGILEKTVHTRPGQHIVIPEKFKGRVDESIFSKPNPKVLSFHFEVAVDGCRWSVITHTNTTDRQRQFPVWESVYDGENVFSRIWDQPRTAQESGPKSRATMRPQASISSGVSPLPGVSMPEIAWLALASNCYLDSVTTNRLKPFWNDCYPTLLLTEYTVPAHWTRMSGETGLPRSIEFVTGEQFGTMSDTGNTLALVDPPANYRTHTNAIYEVLRSQVLADGLEIPTQFRLVRFRAPNEPSVTIEGTVTGIRSPDTSDAINPPPIQEVVAMNDLRFVSNDSSDPEPTVIYPAKTWLAKEDPQVMAVRSLARETPDFRGEEPEPAPPGWTHVILLSALSLASLGILAFLLACRRP